MPRVRRGPARVRCGCSGDGWRTLQDSAAWAVFPGGMWPWSSAAAGQASTAAIALPVCWNHNREPGLLHPLAAHRAMIALKRTVKNSNSHLAGILKYDLLPVEPAVYFILHWMSLIWRIWEASLRNRRDSSLRKYAYAIYPSVYSLKTKQFLRLILMDFEIGNSRIFFSQEGHCKYGRRIWMMCHYPASPSAFFWLFWLLYIDA